MHSTDGATSFKKTVILYSSLYQYQLCFSAQAAIHYIYEYMD